MKSATHSEQRSQATFGISRGARKRIYAVLIMIALVWSGVLIYRQYLAPDEYQPTSVSSPEELQRLWQEYVKDIEPKQ